MEKLIFHVDLDAFFASVERLDNPGLSGKPVVVGAIPGHRGVVSTCSYEARKFGIHSAMPISEALRLCPHAVFLPVRIRRYFEMSKKVMEILASFTPDILQVSIDEAYLDLSGTMRLWGNDEETGRKIKDRLYAETGLTVSIGAARNRYIAKIASGINKPDGFTIVREGEEITFMRSLPLVKLWGAGESTRIKLREIGIVSIDGLQHADPVLLERKFGKAGAEFLHLASLGNDPGIYAAQPGDKSMSGESTFERDTTDRVEILDCLRTLADEISQRLWLEDGAASTLTIKLRFDDFESLTRQTSSRKPFMHSNELYEGAEKLLETSWNGKRPVRLVGLGVSGIGKRYSNDIENLFPESYPKSGKVEEAIFSIMQKGKGKITRARFLGKSKGRSGS
jgi:DNA polymerase-4